VGDGVRVLQYLKGVSIDEKFSSDIKDGLFGGFLHLVLGFSTCKYVLAMSPFLQ